MNEPRPKRRWYRKKRWWAVGLLWLVATYPVGRGPVEYAASRGWLSAATVSAVYGPLDRRLDPSDTEIGPIDPVTGEFDFDIVEPSPIAVSYWRYIGWWRDLSRPAP